ncbi:hypothetical protein MFIFM68171_09694 [Madurella fahalii]|uniref:Uncharacterized protein n=1 Tax=Madurella fahalii TaxID=1157608 RepID=A0ABQ0GP18_9PEZI
MSSRSRRATSAAPSIRSPSLHPQAQTFEANTLDATAPIELGLSSQAPQEQLYWLGLVWLASESDEVGEGPRGKAGNAGGLVIWHNKPVRSDFHLTTVSLPHVSLLFAAEKRRCAVLENGGHDAGAEGLIDGDDDGLQTVPPPLVGRLYFFEETERSEDIDSDSHQWRQHLDRIAPVVARAPQQSDQAGELNAKQAALGDWGVVATMHPK